MESNLISCYSSTISLWLCGSACATFFALSGFLSLLSSFPLKQTLGWSTGCDGYQGFKCSDSYNCDGCKWRLCNWGTKENFFAPLLVDEDLDEEIGFLYYEFETAWSPPEPVIKKMGAMFPELDFELRYFKADSGFNGILVIEHGEVEFEDRAAYYGHRGG